MTLRVPPLLCFPLGERPSVLRILRGKQITVQSCLVHQFLVPANLHDPPGSQDDNYVGVSDRTELVSHYNPCTAEFSYVLLNDRLRNGVKRTGCFIEKEYDLLHS